MMSPLKNKRRGITACKCGHRCVSIGGLTLARASAGELTQTRNFWRSSPSYVVDIKLPTSNYFGKAETTQLVTSLLCFHAAPLRPKSSDAPRLPYDVLWLRFTYRSGYRPWTRRLSTLRRRSHPPPTRSYRLKTIQDTRRRKDINTPT